MRKPYFDNAKWLLMVLVVVGHALEIVPGERTLALYKLIYLFHMPCFVLITGYFSTQDAGKSILYFLILYVLFQTAYLLFQQNVLHSDLPTRYGYPGHVLWYLIACVVWKVFTPYLARIRFILPLMVIIALWVGYDTSFDRHFAISRIIVYFPFFLIGYQFAKRKRKPPKPLPWPIALGILAGLFFLLVWAGERLPRALFLHTAPYAAVGLEMDYAFVFRLLLYFLSAAASAAFLSLAPTRPTWYSGLGARTMPVFLLHSFLAQYLTYIQFGQRIDTPWKWCLYVLGAVALAFALLPFGCLLKPLEKLADMGMRK